MRVEHSLYEVLDVPPDATAEQIRHAYRLAARRTHPDAGGSSPAFERVTIAYQVLGDPDRRRRYDLRIAAAAAARTGRPPGTASPGTAGPGPARPGTGRPGTGDFGTGSFGARGPGTGGFGAGGSRTGGFGGAGPGVPPPSGPGRPGGESTAPGPHPAGAQGPPEQPGADPVVRRRYLALMALALTLFISAGAIVRQFSVPAAMIMAIIAAMIPPIAVTVAGRSRQPPPGPDPRHPR
jgi:hypothetical protein